MKSNERAKPTLQATEAEKLILALFFRHGNNPDIVDVFSILRAEHFSDPKYSCIYNTILTIFLENRVDIDAFQIRTSVLKSEQFAAVFKTQDLLSQTISDLIQLAVSITDVEKRVNWCQILLEFHGRRKLQQLCETTLDLANDLSKDIFGATNELAENALSLIDSIGAAEDEDSLSPAVTEALLNIEKATMGTGAIDTNMVPTPFASLSEVIHGFGNSDLIIVAGRPAMGKSIFGIKSAIHAALKHDKRAVVFSLEMSKIQLINRMFSMLSDIESTRFKVANGLTATQFQSVLSAGEAIMSSPIKIYDNKTSLSAILSKLRKLNAKQGIDLVIIDYLQLITLNENGTRSGTREQEIAAISRELKQAAKKLNVPIIALSQLSRSVESRGGDKRPQLADLRESGAIEQDADLVIFLYRPEYYGFDSDDEGNPTNGVAEIIVAKHRNGALGTAKVKFVPQYVDFRSLDGNYGNYSSPYESEPASYQNFADITRKTAKALSEDDNLF